MGFLQDLWNGSLPSQKGQPSIKEAPSVSDASKPMGVVRSFWSGSLPSQREVTKNSSNLLKQVVGLAICFSLIALVAISLVTKTVRVLASASQFVSHRTQAANALPPPENAAEAPAEVRGKNSSLGHPGSQLADQASTYRELGRKHPDLLGLFKMEMAGHDIQLSNAVVEYKVGKLVMEYSPAYKGDSLGGHVKMVVANIFDPMTQRLYALGAYAIYQRQSRLLDVLNDRANNSSDTEDYSSEGELNFLRKFAAIAGISVAEAQAISRDRQMARSGTQMIEEATAKPSKVD
jgi:hypothetical protein